MTIKAIPFKCLLGHISIRWFSNSETRSSIICEFCMKEIIEGTIVKRTFIGYNRVNKVMASIDVRARRF